MAEKQEGGKKERIGIYGEVGDGVMVEGRKREAVSWTL